MSWLSLDDKIRTSNLYVPRENLLFMKCGDCHKRITWRNTSNMNSLVASCCKHCFNAVPNDEQGAIFRIIMSDVDMSNVIILSAIG